jgi:hypothetical protein
MKRLIRLISLTILIFTITACAGQMKGVDRYSGERVYFSYDGQKFGPAEIEVTLPDGERFVGGRLDEPLAVNRGKDYPNIYEFQGNTEIFLQGDRGGKMLCRFRLSDPILGFRGGGFGLCQTADGRIIDVYPR